MKRLLIVTTISSTLRAFLLPFAYHFRAQGWQVDAMAQGVSNCNECKQAFDLVWEVEWSRNPLDPKNLLAAPLIIQELMAQEKYDLVHVHTPVAAFVTRYALKDLSKQRKCKVIYTAHGFHFHRGGQLLKNIVFLGLEKLAGLWTDYLVVINREDELAAKQYHILPSERVRYMPGIGVNLDHYSPQEVPEGEVVRVREELGLSPENPLLLSVAEFIPRKHHRDVIQAFAKLSRPKVHLAFAGRGPLLKKMQLLAADMGVKNQVHFLGRRDDIPTLMRASVATILASEQEGLPRSVMESLSLEIPVIGTRIRGTQELLEGGYGLLVETGNINKLMEAMDWVLEHPQEAHMMGKRGREHISAYDLRQILKLHEDLYTVASFCQI
ncbi:glycosyltransferase [Nostoc sp. NMS8]|uniref:glycosyltransferase n=1 Tax=Nostoc sp. NMS8 TaxID=2815392 RepID=UPI0025D274BD|nr:glycosyltransferase [Nostoc sp. NMS8]MBN3960625.1 glycosyltransferase [Nostoc sp. NMS8]